MLSNESTNPSGVPPFPTGATRQAISLCVACGRPIDVLFAYCPYCGRRQRKGDAWYYHPVWIAVLALFVLGPLALGLVWRSQRMNRTVKFALSIGIAAYTVFTAYYLYEAIAYEFSMLSDLDTLIR